MAISKDEIYQKLQDIFRREFDDPSIVLTPQTTSAQIPGWDSHRQVEIILACEETFSVRLKPREINAMENVEEIVNHLASIMNR